MPKPGEILIPFDERKIDAMRKFPIGAAVSFEEELLAAAENLYKKRVPDAVRYLFGDDVPAPAKKRRKEPSAIPLTTVNTENKGGTLTDESRNLDPGKPV